MDPLCGGFVDVSDGGRPDRTGRPAERCALGAVIGRWLLYSCSARNDLVLFGPVCTIHDDHAGSTPTARSVVARSLGGDGVAGAGDHVGVGVDERPQPLDHVLGQLLSEDVETSPCFLSLRGRGWRRRTRERPIAG